MKVWRSTTFVLRWLTASVGHFLLWTFWLLLAVVLIVQIGIACTHELRVPARVVQAFQDRLAVAGLRATFDSASFDPSGHIVIENLRIFSDSFEEPLATSPSIFARIDPWALAVGTFTIDSISGHALTFFVPPMLSPSGRSEAVLSDVDFALGPGPDGGFDIQRLIGHAGSLLISCHGRIGRIHRSDTEKKSSAALASNLLQDYLHLAGQISLGQDRLGAFEDPALHILLTPDPIHSAQARVTFLARSAELTANTLKLTDFPHQARVQDLHLEANLPLIPLRHLAWQVRATASGVEFDGTKLQSLALKVSGQLRLHPMQVDAVQGSACAAEVVADGTTVRGVNAQVEAKNWPQLSIETSARVENENWAVRAQGDPRKQAFHVAAEGRVSPEILQLVSEKSRRDLTALLSLPEPAPLWVKADFGAGAKFERAQARFDARNLVAHHVALDRAAAEVTYDGNNLSANEVTLLQPGNQAHGSYWMNTKNLDYRFLLTGTLRPEGIAGWFHEWWPNFWSRFDFSPVAPVADVDVQGRWREPHLSTVFIHVDAIRPSIRTVPFDLVRTTLFIRPDFYDAVEFYATRGVSTARGHFNRSVDLEEHDFRTMDFGVETNFDLQEGARLFGAEGTDLVEPFIFAHPPQLKISGHLDGEASPLGKHQSISIAVDSTGDFRFFDFPLSDLRCEADVQDHTISLKKLNVGFAGGVATGTAQVTGEGNKRHLVLQTDLLGANLGEAINILDQFGSRTHGGAPKSSSRFQERMASGQLDLHAAAEGEYHNLLSFVGIGHAELRGAALGEINLLGALSSALRGNSVLGFTSWNLDTARASFTLDHDKLQLPDFQITGPTAKIDGHGSYSLSNKTINIHAKFYPFEEGKTLLANAVGFVLTPVSAALELKLLGSLDKPKWFFEYGPTNFLRKLTNAAKNEPSAPAPEEPPKTPDYTPPLFLRR